MTIADIINRELRTNPYVKKRYTSTHDEERNETFYFCDGQEIDPEEFCEDDLPWREEDEDN